MLKSTPLDFFPSTLAVTIFWKKNPALLMGVAVLLGLLTAFKGYLACLAFVPVLLTTEDGRKLLTLSVFVTSLLLANYIYTFPTQEDQGHAEFTIGTPTQAKGGGFIYKATLKKFQGEHTQAAHIPCRLFSKTKYDPAYVYQVDGKLTLKRGLSSLRLETKNKWVPLRKKALSLSTLRQKCKGYADTFIHAHIPSSPAAAFLSSLLTGETSDPIQRYVFGKLGLAHLFAISGFHFVLVATFFKFLLRPFFNRYIEALFLLLLLTAFFLFIGTSASVERAWGVAIFSCIALLVGKEGRSLNTLGISLLIVLATNPYFANELSFQLSFLATFGILLFYAPLERLLRPCFPLALLRKPLALNLAVHLALLPLLLYTFHTFQLHSLIYNLFFPFLVTLALFLFLFSAALYVLLPFQILFTPATLYTQLILEITEFPPFPLKTLYLEHFPAEVMVVWLLGVLFGGIYLTKREASLFLEF